MCDAAIGQYRIHSNVLKVIINVSDHIFLNYYKAKCSTSGYCGTSGPERVNTVCKYFFFCIIPGVLDILFHVS